MENQTKNYKATFILDTRGYEQPVETIGENLQKVLTGLGAKVTQVKNHGRINFARIPDKRHTGDTYYELHFTAPLSVPSQLQEKLRLEKTIKRLLVEALT